jgi:hypothetical protein
MILLRSAGGAPISVVKLHPTQLVVMVQFAGSLFYNHKGHEGAQRRSAGNVAFVKLRDLGGYAFPDACCQTAPLPSLW